MTTSETSHNLHAVHSQSESQFNFSTEKMSFFSFKSRPKKSKTSPGHGGEDPEVLEPLQYHQPIYQNTPLLRNNNIDNRNFVDSNSSSAASSRSNTAAILPPGVSLVNPSLQPDKARTFAGIRLPQTFQVRFLGVLPASGIWGIKHTRTVVDGLVEAAKALDSDDLTLLDLEVAEQGIHLRQISPTRPGDTSREIDLGEKPIERISYGVQDVVYPRIFAMIAIKDKSVVIDDRPFDCFVFLCDNRIQSRKLAFCLAKAFEAYGNNIKAANYVQTLQETSSPVSSESSKRSPGSSKTSSMDDSSDA